MTPTAIATRNPTEPTATSTSVSIGTGDIVLKIDTWDGAAIPAGGRVCIREMCQSLGEDGSAAAPPARAMAFAAARPRRSLAFPALPAGVYPVLVTGVAPYADAHGEVTVAEGRTTEFMVVLVLPLPPTVPGSVIETPGTVGANGPNAPDVPDVPTKTSGYAGVSSGTGRSGGGDGTGGVTVRALPNTGIGQPSSNANLLLLLSGMLASIAVGMTTIRRKRS